MFTLVEALNYRCLRHVRQPLKPFHVLVGPNASGKSTFLDILDFVGRLVSRGLDAAVYERSLNFYDLSWGRTQGRFELAVEAEIPEVHRYQSKSRAVNTIRYEIAVGIDEDKQILAILAEQLLLRAGTAQAGEQESGPSQLPTTIFTNADNDCWARVIQRILMSPYKVVPEDHAFSPGEASRDNLNLAFLPERLRTQLGRLPQGLFPASTWFAEVLTRRVSHIELDSRRLRFSSPPGMGIMLSNDGANLPWVVTDFQEQHPQAFQDWLAHLRTAIPSLADIRVVERPEDKHRYLMLHYQGDLEIPSWMLSDGTLRVLALTILAYIPGPKPICLIEEPENSIHPLNIETVMQSLQSVYEGQILVATHSPTVLATTGVSDVLVFSRDEERGTVITPGDQHPGLKNWHGEVSLGTLFAGGVLG